MRIKKFYCVILFLATIGYAQSQPESDKPEIFLQTENVPINLEITFSLEAQTTILTHDYGDYENWYICTNCPNLANEETIWIISGFSHGWGIEWDEDFGSPYEVYSYALYKVYNNISNNYFYIDFRDANYSALGYGGLPDFTIEYDYLTDSYALTPSGADPTIIRVPAK